MTGTTTKLALALTSAFTLASVVVSTAQATQPNANAHAQSGDYFSRSTVQPGGTANPARPRKALNTIPWNMPPVNQQSTPVKWMEAFDDAVGHYKPTLEDALALKKPMNQEVERVMEWSRTTAKIAKNYRLLAKTLRSMPLSQQLPEAGVYRNNMADWYDDTALVMEDLVRPRKPARTMEELEASLKEVHERSEGLRQSYRTLKMMDSKMRQAHNIHPPKHDDALMQYVTRDPNIP